MNKMKISTKRKYKKVQVEIMELRNIILGQKINKGVQQKTR